MLLHVRLVSHCHVFLHSHRSWPLLPSLGVQAGAIFVNQSAEDHFKQAFTSVGLDAETVKEYVAAAIESFEVDAKRTFKNTIDNKIISVGGRRFTDEDLNVRRGSMTMLGCVKDLYILSSTPLIFNSSLKCSRRTQIQQFFDPWVSKIIESVNSQIQGHRIRVGLSRLMKR